MLNTMPDTDIKKEKPKVYGLAFWPRLLRSLSLWIPSIILAIVALVAIFADGAGVVFVSLALAAGAVVGSSATSIVEKKPQAKSPTIKKSSAKPAAILEYKEFNISDRF